MSGPRRRVGAALGAAFVSWAIAVWVLPITPQRNTDLNLFRLVSARVDAGQMPYRDFSLEYPPGALAIFMLPRLFGLSYRLGFALVILAALLVVVWCAMTIAEMLGFSRRRHLQVGLIIALTPLAIGELVAERFDLVVGALVAGMVVAALRGRFSWAWTLLGVAVLVKLVPILLLPVLVVWQRKVRGADLAYGIARFGAVLVVGFVPFLIVAPGGMVDLFRYHLQRPLQIESLGASVMLAAGKLTGNDIQTVFTFGSHNVDTTLAAAVSVIATLALVAAIVALTLRVRRLADRATPHVLVGAVGAVLALSMVAGKVLSPQFLLWLVPFGVLAIGDRWARAASALLFALVLTQVIYPYRYLDLLAGDGLMVAILVARNLLLVVVLVALWPRSLTPDGQRLRSPLLRRLGAGR